MYSRTTRPTTFITGCSKNAEDDPNLPKKKAARALAKFASFHPHNIEQKTEVIVEHFRNKVQHRLGSRAKAMVVTASRLHAVRYKLSFERYIEEKGYADIRPLVAFSGTVRDPDTGLEYTEPGMNVLQTLLRALHRGKRLCGHPSARRLQRHRARSRHWP